MYALWTMFTLGPGMREEADKLGEQFSIILKAREGFKSAMLLSDDSAGEYAGLSLWESKEDAEAALAATESQLKEALSNIAKGPPTRKVFEVGRTF